MSEEYSLGDKDLIKNNDQLQNRLYMPSETQTSSISLYSSFATWKYGINENENCYNSADFDIESLGITSTQYVKTYHIDDYTSTNYNMNIEPKFIVIDTSKINTHEDIFVEIVNFMKGYQYEANTRDKRRTIRNSFNRIKDHLHKFFDDCIFICDRRNNKNENEFVFDFYFTEQKINIRRHYRFVLNHKNNVDVFEQTINHRSKG